ncbi:DeoR/GlpR family DNA-binding transcription regulator [Alicyclobacillus kakegawensis]|uniref:DeoR/GlpR family DNA-binding transcription regulator n=1 Tax=Alicyclobacillus kakegawensis TaxID=392012 RepID=UPI0008297F66|nr:DeoR/GlpR family DNA-binding transcription regulator [Alicyclobacillus kakegawensis]
MKELYTEERRSLILRALRANSRVSVSELAKHFQVSEATIRSDLRRLEEKNLLLRTRGGAIANEDSDLSFANRATQHIEEKQAIAEKALQFIQNHDSILLDASSTCLELAKLLRKSELVLTVVTNGIYTAQALVDNQNIRTILIGGVLRNQNSLEGTLGAELLDKVYASKFFFSARAASPEGELMDFDLQEVELKRVMFERSEDRFCLLDSSKIGKHSVASFGSLYHTKVLISEADLALQYQESIPTLEVALAEKR